MALDWKTIQTVMIMSLEHIVERLIDESKSSYSRAIDLFEFQTAVYRPKASFQRLIATQRDARAPTKVLRTARIFAAIRILEKIEEDLREKRDSSVVSLRDLAADEDYRSIFDDVIATNGGWRRIRQSQSVMAFDESMKCRKKEAKPAAKIVDFSYRYSKHLSSSKYPGKKNPGGVEAAKYVVRKAYNFGKKTTIKNRWKGYKVTAVFVYLLLMRDFDFGPPRVGSRKFVEVLLRQVSNIDGLRKFFCAYQEVQGVLSKLNYKDFPTLDLKLDCSLTQQLDAPVFSPKMQAAFENWLQTGDPD
jgi:hypothetical protein